MKRKKIFWLSLLCTAMLGTLFCACETQSQEQVEESNFQFEETDGGYAVCGVKKIEKGKVEIPSVYNDKTVVAIADGAFEDEDSLVTVIIPDSVRSVGARAFADCNKLETIDFGASVATLKEGAFAKCIAIKEISLPQSLTEIGDNAFNGCGKLKGISIPDNVKAIGDFSFVGCERLKNVEIGDKVERIGQEAFAENELLLTVSISESAPLTIGAKAFYECKALIDVNFGGTVEVGNEAFQSCSKLAEVVLGDSCVSVGESAFSSCLHLTGVTVGESVTSIGDNAFSSCHTLVEVYNRSALDFTVGDTAHGKIARNVLHVYTQEGQSRRFKDEKGVVYYQDGERVIALGQVGFQTGLDIVLDERTTEVYPMAFYNNLNVSSVTFGAKVQTIGKQAFNFCYQLKKIVIGDGVTEIGEKAFNRCSILNMVVLGAGVQKIGTDAFALCELLPTGNVYYKGNTTAFSRIDFTDGNTELEETPRYYYSEISPSKKGNYWYYDQNGKIKLWE